MGLRLLEAWGACCSLCPNCSARLSPARGPCAGAGPVCRCRVHVPARGPCASMGSPPSPPLSGLGGKSLHQNDSLCPVTCSCRPIHCSLLTIPSSVCLTMSLLSQGSSVEALLFLKNWVSDLTLAITCIFLSCFTGVLIGEQSLW